VIAAIATTNARPAIALLQRSTDAAPHHLLRRKRLMRSSIALALTAAALLPAVAAAAPAERSFTRDGHTYVYSLTGNQDGTTLIQGHEVGSSNGRFRLTVNGTRVSGQANGRNVSFRAARPLAPVSVATN
jgi:hypothetical protein